MSILRKLSKITFAIKSKRARRALVNGVGAAIEHKRILGAYRPEVIVDIGANCGQFSLLANEMLPDAIIHAFEPLDGPADVFERVFEGLATVQLHRCAIGKVSEEADMNVSARMDSSSLLSIGEKQIYEYPGTQRASVQKVSVRRLSDVLKESFSGAFLKIDVQGYELSVLQGAEDILEKFSHIYVESSFEELYTGQALFRDVHEFLRMHGFHLRDIGTLSNDRAARALQGDFLFERSSVVANVDSSGL